MKTILSILFLVALASARYNPESECDTRLIPEPMNVQG